MRKDKRIWPIVVFSLLFTFPVGAQTVKMQMEVRNVMLRATKYMVEQVSYNGGYVWFYLPDFSRRWGEMEAYKTMIWLQHPGTISMGHLFLDAYGITHDEYYYLAAEKAANAVIWGQSSEGGWNYMLDFAGDKSLKEWYNTIGNCGWRMEEFQHYYGNSTFDDNITSDATRFLLRMYLEKLDPVYKPALDKAIGFVLKSQYPLGGWPQRYPLMYDFRKNGNPDYTSYYTFNDDVIYENIKLLIQCYVTLGEERFLDPIMRGINFILISQQANGAWGQQYNMELEPVGARTYEPRAILPGLTYENSEILLKFYQFTGDKRLLNAVDRAIGWLEKVKLPVDRTENHKYSHSYYIDIDTGKPIYVHRKGSNVKYGYYFKDGDDNNLLGHTRGKCKLSLETLKSEYVRLKSLPLEELTKNSPLKMGKHESDVTPQKFYDLNQGFAIGIPGKLKVQELVNSLDKENRWMEKHVLVSNPYIGEGNKKEATDKYASTRTGDETDTSPYIDTSDQQYISTRKYIENMRLLMGFLKSK